MRLRPCIRAVAAAVLSLPFGCAEGLPLPEPTWIGEHVEIGTSVDLSETCAGTLAHTDAYVGALRERFGTASSDRIRVFWLPDGVQRYEGCDVVDRQGVLGCAIGKSAMHEYLPAEHEYVHAAWPTDSANLLEEGLASHLGDDAWRDWGPWLWRSAHAAYEAVDEGGYLPGEYYGTAAIHVAYLAERFGLDAVLDVVAATDFGDSADDVDAELRRVLGVSLPDVLTAHLADGYQCDPFHARDATISCDLAEGGPLPCEYVEAGGKPVRGVRIEARVVCGDDGVIGPKLGEIWESHTFEVPEAGEYVVTVAALGDTPLPADIGDFGSITLEACAAGCGRFMLPLGRTVGGVEVLQLSAGRHRVRVARRLDAMSEVEGVEVEIRATAEPTFATLCGANATAPG